MFTYMEKQPSSKHPYQTFTEKYPEAGELRNGAFVSGEQLRQFGDIIGGKVIELSRKQDLTDGEKTFIDRTMDLSVRSVIYANERLGIPIPESENTVTVVEGIADLQGSAPSPRDIVYGLHTLTGSAYSLRTTPDARVPIEEIARGAVQLFGEMGELAGGIHMDAYLEGNLQNIAGHMEHMQQ